MAMMPLTRGMRSGYSGRELSLVLYCAVLVFIFLIFSSPSPVPVPAPQPVVQGDQDEDPSTVMLPSLLRNNAMASSYVNLPHIECVLLRCFFRWLTSFHRRFRRFADLTPLGFDAAKGLESFRANVADTGKSMKPADFK